MCLAFDLQQAMTDFIALPGQSEHINQHTIAFHAIQHFGHRQFKFAVDVIQAWFGGELWL